MPLIPLPLIEVPLLTLESGRHVARALMFHNRTLGYCPRCSLLTEQSMLRAVSSSIGGGGDPGHDDTGHDSDGNGDGEDGHARSFDAGRWACATCLIP